LFAFCSVKQPNINLKAELRNAGEKKAGSKITKKYTGRDLQK
jgi:hypothetical protein